MPAPNEVVAAPLTLYLALIGTGFPAIDDEPADFDPAWELLGTEGDRNYDDTGVTVTHGETVNDFTPAGSTMPTKRFRTAEAIEMKLNLVDVGPTAYAKVMNDAAITTVHPTSGVAGEESFSLFRGDQVNAFALLARGMSPVDNDLNLQYEIAKSFVSVNGDVIWNKGTPAHLPITALAVRHSDSDAIVLRIQTHDAS